MFPALGDSTLLQSSETITFSSPRNSIDASSNCCWPNRERTGNRPTFGSIEGSIDNVTHLFAQQNLHDVPVERLNRIPADERTSVLNDVHGASDPSEESPELVRQCLNEMDAELRSIQPRGAYEEAIEQDADYVKRLRLAFLRAEQFRPAKAAYRMVMYFHTKCSMFGHGSLGRDLRLKDLSAEARRLLDVGVAHMLPERDRSGRGVLFLHYERSETAPSPEIQPLLELLFYWASLAAQDIQLQKVGIILLHYGVGCKFYSDEVNRGRNAISLFSLTMVRCAAVHLCVSYEHMKQLPILNELMQTIVEAHYLIRLQSHFGSHVECLYSLGTFGIPSKILPLDYNGRLNMTSLQNWILENSSSPPSSSPCDGSTIASIQSDHSPATAVEISTIPPAGPDDVVMGRGRVTNAKLKKLLEEYQSYYEMADRFEKLVIVQIVYQRMKESGARFLIPPNNSGSGQWAELSETEAQARISHGFRNIRMRQKRK